MGKNRRGRHPKKSNGAKRPTTVMSTELKDEVSSADIDETDLARFVFTDDGFYMTNDPEIIEQNNHDMKAPAPPLYVQCRGKSLLDFHNEIRLKASSDFSVKCVDNNTILELQLANMYDYKAIKPKIAKYIISAPENVEEEKTMMKKKKIQSVKAVIRGLPWLCDEEAVREGLLYEGFGDVPVKLHNRTNKKRPPLFILAVHKGEDKRQRKDADKIFELTKLLGFQVKVEPLPTELDTKPQCFKCQQEGHVAKYCRNRAICVKCADYHDSRSCTLKKEDQPTCARCHGQHVASWRGCEAFSGYSHTSEKVQTEITSNEKTQDKTADQANTNEKMQGETMNEVDSACDKGTKRKRHRISVSYLLAQCKGEQATTTPLCEQPEDPDSGSGQEQVVTSGDGCGAFSGHSHTSKKVQGETTDQVNSTEKMEDETADQVNSAIDGVAKKRKRRKRRRNLMSSLLAQDEGEQAMVTPLHKQLEDPNRDSRQEVVAETDGAIKTDDTGTQGRKLEDKVAAAVSRLTQQLSATILETVTVVLKTAK